MKAVPKNHLTFVFVITVVLMLPILYIASQYDGVYSITRASLGTMGLAFLLLAIYLLVKPASTLLALLCAISLFFLFLLTRIILSFIYDFSGRGFTSEFFAHFSWDSFVIGFQEYGYVLVLSSLVMLIFGYFMAKLLTAHKSNQIIIFLVALGLSFLLMIYNNRNTPEFRLYKAYQNYHRSIIEIKDVGAVRSQTSQLLKPIRNTLNIPKSKQEIAATLPEAPKNLIIIYLESFSDVLTENPNYPGLTPNLDQLKKDYFSFNNYYTGGYVTIEGIANSQCGTLLNMDSGENSLTSSSGRLPDLACLGDILKTAGYQQVFMGGAELQFAGKGDFFLEHGYDQVWGKHKWEANGFESANVWGLSDADLFDQALNKAVEMSQSDQPFNLTLLTLGTHLPGYSYKGCQPYVQTDANHPFLNGIHCTDFLIGQFINKLDTHGLLEQTVIQIQGDHPIFPTRGMSDLFGHRTKSHDIFNVTIHPESHSLGLNPDKPSTTLNMAANLLDILGVSHNAEFILANSDRQPAKENAYFISRYTDYISDQPHFNANGDLADCQQADLSDMSLPLDFCSKSTVLNAIYQLGATYSGLNNDQQVCTLGVEVGIEESSKKVEVRWGNQVLSGRFQTGGRTIKEAKAGFYLIELDQHDRVLNTMFFDPLKPRDMSDLDKFLKSDNKRYFLISNLTSKTIKKLKLHHLPDSFAEIKQAYIQANVSENQSLFDQSFLTGKIRFIPSSCGDITEVVSHTPEPNLNRAQFCEIESWGPQQVTLGDSFNQQPNGDSAFWIKIPCAPPGTSISFDDQSLKTVERIPTITARIDAEILIQKAGDYAIDLVHEETETKFQVGTFKVLPNETYQPPFTPIKNDHTKPLKAPLLIAHAGGGMNDLSNFNSVDTLNHNYRLGHRYFEIDFSWTSDDALVAIHDWDHTYQRLFGSNVEAPPSLADFMQSKMIHGHQQMDLTVLNAWLADHPDAYIITDIKGRNVEGLKLMIKIMDAAPNQVIPQMKHAYNLRLIQTMGYKNIIFTLTHTKLPYYEIIDYVSKHELFAVTAAPDKKNFKAILNGVNRLETPIYVHTFNTPEAFHEFRNLGAHGIYTDYLYLNQDGTARIQ